MFLFHFIYKLFYLGLKRTHKKDTCQQKPLCRSLHLIQAKAMLDLGGQDNIEQTIKMLTKVDVLGTLDL